MMLYFAYGSNMLTARLKDRVPSANSKSTGCLFGYSLTFNKKSIDGSGKANIERTQEDDAVVHGVIFELDPSERNRLDRAEGLGRGYDERAVTVTTAGGKIEAFTYVATDKDDLLRPYHWYKALVVAGAKEFKLPREYVEMILEVASWDDPDQERRRRNIVLLSAS